MQSDPFFHGYVLNLPYLQSSPSRGPRVHNAVLKLTVSMPPAKSMMPQAP